jgi:glutaredoxin
MDVLKRWLLPLLLGILLAFVLLRNQKPIQVFASEDERLHFLQEIGEERDVRLIALVTEWCPACRALESALEQVGVEYAKVDLDRSVPGQQLLERCVRLGGSRGLPKTIYGLEMLSAHDAVSRLKKEQGGKEPSPDSQ